MLDYETVKKQVCSYVLFLSEYTSLMFEYITVSSVNISLSFYINPSETLNLYVLI